MVKIMETPYEQMDDLGGNFPTISVNIHIYIPLGAHPPRGFFQKKIPTVSPMTWLPLAGGRTPTAAGGLPAVGLSVSRWVRKNITRFRFDDEPNHYLVIQFVTFFGSR